MPDVGYWAKRQEELAVNRAEMDKRHKREEKIENIVLLSICVFVGAFVMISLVAAIMSGGSSGYE